MDRIQFEDVSKRYALGERGNLRESIAALTTRKCATNELWSLRDVSFTVREGEALGIVGRNGAGKSTILKILMRITAPTRGVSRTRGRVAALLEVGTGFHPELTGRENVFLNAAILGMSRVETRRRFDQIVEFSGTARFLDTPVKRYSSGMYLRLAFAVAAHLEPDILIVDEVLAVGDAEFQRKCLGRMSEAEREGRTVVFVSHDLTSLARLCPRTLWLDSGRVLGDGPTQSVVRDYLSAGVGSSNGEHRFEGSGPMRLLDVTVRPSDRGEEGALIREDALRVGVVFELLEEVPGADVAVFLTNSQGARVIDEMISDTAQPKFGPGRHEVVLEVPPVLNTGDYTVGVWLGTALEDCVVEPTAASFTLHGGNAARPDRAVVLGLPFTVVE